MKFPTEKESIERLRVDHLQPWIQALCKTHLDVFVDCLMPHPSDYCKVGGLWWVH